MLANDPLSQGSRRYVAIRLLAEQRIAVAGNQPVEPVAKRARQEFEQPRRAPWPAEFGKHGDQAVQPQMDDAVDDDEVRLVDVGSQPVPAVKRFAQRRLRRREAELPAAVEAYDELGEAGAENADAVENDERMAAVKDWGCRTLSPGDLLSCSMGASELAFAGLYAAMRRRQSCERAP